MNINPLHLNHRFLCSTKLSRITTFQHQSLLSIKPYHHRPVPIALRNLPCWVSHRTTTTTTKTASSKMSTASASTTPLLPAAVARRTIYQLGDTDTPISDARIQELVNNTVLHVPSAFNSQTTRVVLVLGEEHKRLWDIITDVYRQQLSDEKFKSAEGKFKGFRAGYGTVSSSLLIFFSLVGSRH